MPKKQPLKSSHFDNPALYVNRERSALQFNRRVLALAQDAQLPLLERLKFLCILSSNIDEFFEIRVSQLIREVAMTPTSISLDGLTPQVQLEHIAEIAHQLISEQYQCLNADLLPSLAAEHIRFLRRRHWNREQQQWIRDYFEREVFPVLTPLSLDPSHPFPQIQNKALSFAVTLEGEDAYGRISPIAVVQAPRILPRIIKLPTQIAGPNDFAFLSSVIHDNVERLFPGLKVRGFHQFRVTRNSNLSVDEDEAENLLDAVAEELVHRQYGEAVRLEVADTCPPAVIDFLLGHFELERQDLYQVHGPVNLPRLMQVIELVNRPELLYPPFVPAQLPEDAHSNIFERLKQQALLLHHPYQSFLPVVSFIQQAAQDPEVLSIKQTIYRTSVDSPVTTALVDAAKAGKQVVAVVELKARFDEANNIHVVEALEAVGAQVIYGIVGHKTHAKMTLIARREASGIRLYGHLGTGNYHPRTARQYTDLSLLTADTDLTQDMHDLFMHLTGLGQAPTLRKLWQAPFTLHSRLLQQIHKEAQWGAKGRIIVRLNALLDPEIISALYAASAAGVQIDLIVRGLCSLRPGVTGVSENIRVISVLGRFLEHSRVYYFGNNGDPLLWAASADWMERSFFRRVEIAFPIEDPALKQRVLEETLSCYLQDNCRAWDMQPDGHYIQRHPQAGQPCRAAQDILLGRLSETTRHSAR